jgi:hypothetical protein
VNGSCSYVQEEKLQLRDLQVYFKFYNFDQVKGPPPLIFPGFCDNSRWSLLLIKK